MLIERRSIGSKVTPGIFAFSHTGPRMPSMQIFCFNEISFAQSVNNVTEDLPVGIMILQPNANGLQDYSSVRPS